MENKILLEYLDTNDYDLKMLNIFSNIIPMRFEKVKNYYDENKKLQSLLAGVLVYKNFGDIEKIILYNKLNKPYLQNNNVYFNISHSKNFVVFVKDNKKIGVDIEFIRDRNIHIINKVCNEKEKQIINNNIYEFTKYWTIKESVFKASSSDIYIDFKDIDATDDKKISFMGENYNIISKRFGDFYISVASINKFDDVIISKANINDLIVNK